MNMILAIYKKLFDDDNYYLEKGNPIMSDIIEYSKRHDTLLMNDEILVCRMDSDGFFFCNSNVFGKIFDDEILVVGHHFKSNEDLKNESISDIENVFEFKELVEKIIFKLTLNRTLKNLNINNDTI